MFKLHLGCGKRSFPGWTHIDAGNYLHLHSHNIVNLPFEDNSCDLIYASHVISYFDRQEIGKLFEEWGRVLTLGGILRIAVPDFEQMSQLYVLGEFPLESFLGPLYGRMLPNGLNKPIYHKTVFDFDNLKQLLENCWFHDICRWDWRKTEHAHFDDHSMAYLPHMDKENGTLISLNIEATK